VSRASLQRAVVVMTAALVLTVTFSSGADAASAPRAADSPPANLTAAMLDTGDLPAGFRPDGSLTGPLNAQRAREQGLNPSQIGSRAAWVRTWLAPQVADVVEIGIDAGTHDDAQAQVADVARLAPRGTARLTIAGPVRLDAFGISVQVDGTRLWELVLPLARGPYFFVLRVYVPASSVASTSGLMSQLAAAQIRKVPADTPDTAPSGADPAEVSGSVVGALIGYLLIVNGVAYLRNPLRRRLARSRHARPAFRGPGVSDVSATAKRNKRTAVWRLAVQLAGLGIVAYAADVFQVRYWYAYLVAGLAVVWAGGRFIHPAGAHRDKNRAVIAGSHRILVAVMLVLASVMILFGLAVIVSGGLNDSLPPGATVPSLSGQGSTTAQNLAPDLLDTGLGLLVLGAILTRSARRLGSIDARRLLLRDPRPPVLYLRSFGDDRLRLWTATFGRASLVERFTLRRFDRFEEVLVRYLSRYGPVIAVNPPGTRLAPLGAARETIDSANWQSTVAAWMAQSAVIVFLAPPSRVSPGLQWELRNVSERGYWDKALVVVPPVRPEQLQGRWQGLRDAHAGLWPFTAAGPVDDPRALVLMFRDGQWDVAAADRRTEWSYAAALEQALGDPRRLAPPARGPQPGARRAPRTILVAALIVLVVGIVAGAGTWYAVRQAPAARLSAAATTSPSSVPSWVSPSQSPENGSAVSSSPSASPADLVSLAPAAAQYPDATAIQAVINQYFQAINDRDYAAYLATQSPGNALTARQFQTGFESTQDSDVLVTNIANAADGRPAADVSFTSQQQPQDGPDGESCTNWQVTMFFDSNAGTYSIGAPPGDYQASYQACS
jgi:hypothetical protein